MWWREEVLERVRRVPAAVPIEADPECEEVEDDGEPQKAVGGREARFVTNRLACGDGSRAQIAVR